MRKNYIGTAESTDDRRRDVCAGFARTDDCLRDLFTSATVARPHRRRAPPRVHVLRDRERALPAAARRSQHRARRSEEARRSASEEDRRPEPPPPCRLAPRVGDTTERRNDDARRGRRVTC